jgi:hypothetical protein
VKITPLQRRVLLFAIAFALVAAAIFDGEGDHQGSLSAAAAPRVARPQAQAMLAVLPDIALDKLDQKIARDRVIDAFETRSWEPAEPKPAPPATLPPPPAPPLPYTYVGKIMDDGKVTVFLAKSDRNYVVKQGETLDGAYRVDEIKGGVMVFTYLPLDQKQILAIGAAN